MDFLFGRGAVFPYRVAFIVAILIGSVLELETLFLFSDVANGLMALPNLIGLLLLSGVVARETRQYFRHRRARYAGPADSERVR
jgi:AGCS family alanine or glycine:cation symporter